MCVLNIHCSLTPVSEFRISTLERCSKEWANTQNVGQRAIGMRYSTDVLMILLLSNNLHSVYKMCNDGCTVKAPCPSANILISLKIKRTKKKKDWENGFFFFPWSSGNLYVNNATSCWKFYRRAMGGGWVGLSVVETERTSFVTYNGGRVGKDEIFFFFFFWSIWMIMFQGKV